MGSIAEQNIRTKSKPIIQEIDSKWVLCHFGVIGGGAQSGYEKEVEGDNLKQITLNEKLTYLFELAV